MTNPMAGSSILKAAFEAHLEVFQSTFTGPQIQLLLKICEEIVSAFRGKNKILLCGNGGSAADAQHIAAEFIGRFKKERKSLPAIALTTDSSILTAVANDYSYDVVFQRQVEGLGVNGDVFIGISTSGNSKNIIFAAQKARQIGMRTIGFTGASGGALKDVVDINFSTGVAKTPHIQEMHMAALHAVSEAVEEILFQTAT
jgi:D-sedoheptulose 7-phosphate isomerase